jgi:chitodextrinase/5-hydroxyisourate hydrolase-like protein (transthyretin family)
MRTSTSTVVSTTGAGLLLACLVAPTATGAPTHQQAEQTSLARSSVKLHVSRHRAMQNEIVKLAAAVAPGARRTVVLEWKNTGSWTPLTSAHTKRSGRHTFRWHTPSTTVTKYRVVALPTARYAKSVSRVQRVHLADQAVTLRLRGSAQVGHKVRATVRAKPARKGRHIVLQVQKGSHWKRVARKTASAKGRVHFRVPTGKPGTFTYRARANRFHGGYVAFSPGKVIAVNPDTTAPPVPQGLAATAGDGRVHLTWSKVHASDLKGYAVYVSVDGGTSWTRVKTGGPVTATRYTVKGLDNGTAYSFAVKSVDRSANRSAFSNVASATPRDSTPPATPQNVQATPGDSQVTVSWDAVPDSDLAGYRVFYATASTGPWTEFTTGPVSGTSLDVTGLTNGTPYWFKVQAEDTSGNLSADSNTPTATPGP